LGNDLQTYFSENLENSKIEIFKKYPQTSTIKQKTMEINLLDIIDNELIADGFDTELLDDYINWEDGFGANNEIFKQDIAYNGKSIAWWQRNEVGKDILRIRLENEVILSWRPKARHHSWGFLCGFIQWFDNQLIVKYKNKHTDYIFRFDGLKFKQLFSGSIGYFAIKNEMIYIKEPSYHQGRLLKLNLLGNEEVTLSSTDELIRENIDFI
jgi:hypothetical protein